MNRYLLQRVYAFSVSQKKLKKKNTSASIDLANRIMRNKLMTTKPHNTAWMAAYNLILAACNLFLCIWTCNWVVCNDYILHKTSCTHSLFCCFFARVCLCVCVCTKYKKFLKGSHILSILYKLLQLSIMITNNIIHENAQQHF